MKLKQILLSLLVAIFLAIGSGWAGDMVNINTASAGELQQVDGIGATMAAKIVAYREAHGRFTSVNDLLKIKGIGKKKLAKAKDELTVEKKK